ncbi:MAG: 4Fe-4S dicluster domain-containing protein [Candidatus Omnitrophota bacterium]|nr:4Fe-4S dicluster domain-containing protein [Candidatus Omnitrophota bacterium]
MRYPKIRELIEAVKALLTGPYTLKKPQEPAKRFRGKPEYSDEGCVGCAACALVCPCRAIEARDIITPDKAARKMILHLDECHYCGQCSALCTTRDDNPSGIKHTTKYDLASFDRIDMVSTTDEKELALCEACGTVITTRAHLNWLAKRLGPLAFSNPTLFVASLKNMGFSDDVLQNLQRWAVQRSDRIKVLCSKCRRSATIEKF